MLFMQGITQKVKHMEKLKMHSPDMTQQNIEKIQALFPNCVTESRGANGELKLAIDFDQLKQELSNSIVEGPQERYQLNWPGKREALLTANAPIAKTLRPCREESVNFDTTENLFIEGDNLDALKMLQETYLGKVKMIYIDPPYNTGNDFIYEDDFAENSDGFLKRSNQKDEEGKRLIANTESNGRFHSDWLSMIFSRLKLARNILSSDGIIFISIDENELDNLLKIGKEIFGEENHITTFCWEKKKKPSFLNKNVGSKFEYIVTFSKNRDYTGAFSIELTTEGKKYPLNNAGNSLGNLVFPAGSVRFNLPDQIIEPQDMSEGKIKTKLITRLEVIGGKNVNEFILEGEWRYSQNRLNEILENREEIIISKIPFRPNHVKAGGETKKMHNLLSVAHYKVSTNEDADAESSELMGNKYFDYTKPSNLIKLLIQAITYDDQECLVLDFFAGSSTTAHAVMQLNAEDGGNRKFVMVQLPEECDKKSEAFKAGYKTIAEISKERIRRAGAKILAGECHTDWNKDVGFRVLKVDTSNMADVYYSPDQVSQGSLDLLVDNIKSDRTDEDLLFQVLLDWGVDLTLPIRKETIQGKTVFFVDDDALVACFDLRINEALIKELATKEPLRVVFRDDGFESDAVKINAEQIFKQVSPHTEVKAI